MNKYQNTIDTVKQLFEDRDVIECFASDEFDARSEIREVLEREILGRCGFAVVFNTTSKGWTDRAVDELARLRIKFKKSSFNCICKCHDDTLTRTGWDVWENCGMVKMCHYRDFDNWLPDGYVVFWSDRCPICGAELGSDTKYSRSITNGMRKI